MKVVDCIQGSPEWHAARCGRATASRVPDIVRKIKSGAPSKMRVTYAGELIAERLSGVQPQDGFVSPAMQFGKDMEDQAAATYGFMHDIEPIKVGFVIHPTIDMAGASPDRLIGDHGLIQVKVPNTATHIESLLGGEIEPDYVKQMQWELACTKRQWIDFVSFDPRLPPHMQLHTKRVARDDKYIAELEEQVRIFLNELDQKLAALNARYGLEKAA